jgi:hypothetical protein
MNLSDMLIAMFRGLDGGGGRTIPRQHLISILWRPLYLPSFAIIRIPSLCIVLESSVSVGK